MEQSINTTTFDKYNAEITEELDLSDFNIKDIQMKLPAIKHKWVSRMIQQKIELNKLKKMKLEAIDAVTQNLRKSNPVMLSDSALSKQAEKNDTVQKIILKMEECELLIEYLEKVERLCNGTTYDIKNLVDIKKLELS
jgi:hypothetical protein